MALRERFEVTIKLPNETVFFIIILDFLTKYKPCHWVTIAISNPSDVERLIVERSNSLVLWTKITKYVLPLRNGCLPCLST